jgi:type VI secretion system protein ImpF
MNTGSYATTVDLALFPEVATSVLNYGIPDISGSLFSNVDVKYLESCVKQAILNFEPRIFRRSLQVTATTNEEASAKNAIVFQIEAEAWGPTAPMTLTLKTEMDLETGIVSITDFGG